MNTENNGSNGAAMPSDAASAAGAAAGAAADLGAQAARQARSAWSSGRARDFRGRGLSLGDFSEEVTSILDDVGYLLRHESVVNPELKAQLEQRFDRLRGTVSLLAEDARQTGERVRTEVHDRVQAGLVQSRDAVVERPITAVATATVVGVAIGLLLARRR